MVRPSAGWIAFLAALLAWGTLSPIGLAQTTGVKTVSDTVSFPERGTVSLENERGSIRVETWERDAVGYEVRLEPTSPDSVLVSDLTIDQSKDEIDFELGDNSWSIRIPGIVTISPGGTTTPVADYRVRIPTTANLEINDRQSDIWVSGVRADVEINSYEGHVEVDSVHGMLNLDTYNATANATHLQGGVTIETYDGTVEASFDEFSQASSVDSYSGTVRLHLPSTAGFEVGGDLEEMDLTVAESFGAPTTEDGRRIYGGGGIPLSFETYSGRIEIHANQSGASSGSR